LSNQVLASDSKLKQVMTDISSSKIRVLEKAGKILDKQLNGSDSFKVKEKKISKTDKQQEPEMALTIQMDQNQKSIPLFIEMQNGKPVIRVPVEAKKALAEMKNDEAKFLR